MRRRSTSGPIGASNPFHWLTEIYTHARRIPATQILSAPVHLLQHSPAQKTETPPASPQGPSATLGRPPRTPGRRALIPEMRARAESQAKVRSERRISGNSSAPNLPNSCLGLDCPLAQLGQVDKTCVFPQNDSQPNGYEKIDRPPLPNLATRLIVSHLSETAVQISPNLFSKEEAKS